MKLILTGSTGSVGGAVLRHCLLNPSVTSIVALTRRPLEIKDPKITNIIHKDYLKYEPEVIEQLKGAQGCVWALGSPTSGKTVHIDYTRTAINVFLTHLVPQLPEGKPFRFVYTSGGLVPYLDSGYLFFLGPARKLRGDMDREILALESQHPGRWESFVARPWHVVDEAPTSRFTLISAFILKPELGAAMTDAALNGGVERIMTNEEMKVKGQEVIKSLGV